MRYLEFVPRLAPQLSEFVPTANGWKMKAAAREVNGIPETEPPIQGTSFERHVAGAPLPAQMELEEVKQELKDSGRTKAGATAVIIRGAFRSKWLLFCCFIVLLGFGRLFPNFDLRQLPRVAAFGLYLVVFAAVNMLTVKNGNETKPDYSENLKTELARIRQNIVPTFYEQFSGDLLGLYRKLSSEYHVKAYVAYFRSVSAQLLQLQTKIEKYIDDTEGSFAARLAAEMKTRHDALERILIEELVAEQRAAKGSENRSESENDEMRGPHSAPLQQPRTAADEEGAVEPPPPEVIPVLLPSPEEIDRQTAVKLLSSVKNSDNKDIVEKDSPLDRLQRQQGLMSGDINARIEPPQKIWQKAVIFFAIASAIAIVEMLTGYGIWNGILSYDMAILMSIITVGLLTASAHFGFGGLHRVHTQRDAEGLGRSNKVDVEALSTTEKQLTYGGLFVFGITCLSILGSRIWAIALGTGGFSGLVLAVALVALAGAYGFFFEYEKSNPYTAKQYRDLKAAEAAVETAKKDHIHPSHHPDSVQRIRHEGEDKKAEIAQKNEEQRAREAATEKAREDRDARRLAAGQAKVKALEDAQHAREEAIC